MEAVAGEQLEGAELGGRRESRCHVLSVGIGDDNGPRLDAHIWTSVSMNFRPYMLEEFESPEASGLRPSRMLPIAIPIPVVGVSRSHAAALRASGTVSVSRGAEVGTDPPVWSNHSWNCRPPRG